MFGLGIGEILLILLLIFILSPKDIPRFFRKLGQAWGALDKLRGQIAEIGREVGADTAEPAPKPVRFARKTRKIKKPAKKAETVKQGGRRHGKTKSGKKKG